jgi:hypothetical protein
MTWMLRKCQKDVKQWWEDVEGCWAAPNKHRASSGRCKTMSINHQGTTWRSKSKLFFNNW